MSPVACRAAQLDAAVRLVLTSMVRSMLVMLEPSRVSRRTDYDQHATTDQRIRVSRTRAPIGKLRRSVCVRVADVQRVCVDNSEVEQQTGGFQ